MNKVQAEDLFRKQALQSLAEKPPGRPICLMPRPWLWLMFLIAAIFVSAGLFVGTAEYARTETVRGWLVANPGIVRVAHAGGAQILRVLREPGDVIEKGEPLLLLSTDSSLIDGSSKNEEVIGRIRAAIAELEQQQAFIRQRSELDVQSLQRQLGATEREDLLRQQEIGAATHRVTLEQEKHRKLASLRKSGAVTEWDLLRQQDEISIARQALNQLRQKESVLQRERERLASSIAASPVSVQATISALRSEAFRLSTDLAEYQSRRSFLLLSPIAGTVASAAAQVGSATIAQQTLMTILPADWQLAAELFVPSRAAGFLHPGQSVRLNYDAFPRQKFGPFAGRIERVSDFVLLPAEVPQTFSLREATYKVRVQVLRKDVVTGLRNARLRPGMLLAAEIVLEKRNLIDWLLEPLRSRRDDSV
jgi:membrane fusion protein